MTDFIERRANPPPAEGWHLDKKVPLSLIFAMLVQAGMVIWAIADIKKDVELLKQDVMHLAQRDTKIELDNKEIARQLQDAFLRMEVKLDRLIERRQ